jgi:NAD(P)-dependent dehydrogenase (short-subunit alcohol dehydrogenase family)
MRKIVLNNKVILITGATSGIGAAAARTFAREGANVVLSGRRAKLGEVVAAEIRAAGGNASYYRADISRESDVEALVASIIRTYGRLDGAFNNARVERRFRTLVESAAADFDTTLAVNFRGTWLAMRAEARAMLLTGGAIVNTSSSLATNGFPRGSIDSATKGAIDAMTRAVALELADTNIRVNTIQRYGSPEEIAATAAWLCSDAASSITGETVSVNRHHAELRAS